MSFEIKSTFGTSFFSFATQASTNLLAISEFIDNSISSQQKENGKISELKITIIICNGRDNQKIIIADNAFGMNDCNKIKEKDWKFSLKRAIQPHDTQGKNHKDINVYGVGMKLGMFWYSYDVEIFTKRKNQEYYLQIPITITEKNFNSLAVLNINRIKKCDYLNEHGTCIILKNIYDGGDYFGQPIPSRTINDSKLSLLLEQLRWRYGRFIEDGLTLQFVVTSEDDTGSVQENEPIKLHPYKYTYYNLRNLLLINLSNDEEKIKKLIENNHDKHIKEQYDKLLNKYDGQINPLKKLLEGNDLKFSFPFTIENKEVQIHFGVLPLNLGKNKKNFNEYNGFTLYHAGRALFHGPNPKSSLEQANDFPIRNKDIYDKFEQAGSGKHVRRRIFGWIDLTNIYPTAKNKNNFLFGPNWENDFSQIVKKVMTLEPFLNFLKQIELQLQNNNVEPNPGGIDDGDNSIVKKMFNKSYVGLKNPISVPTENDDDPITIRYKYIDKKTINSSSTYEFDDNEWTIDITINISYYGKQLYNSNKKTIEIIELLNTLLKIQEENRDLNIDIPNFIKRIKDQLE